MQGTSCHQEDLLQDKTTHHILGKFNTAKKDIIKEFKKKGPALCVEGAKNASSIQNYVLLTFT